MKYKNVKIYMIKCSHLKYLIFCIILSSCNNIEKDYYENGSLKSTLSENGEYIEYNHEGKVIKKGLLKDNRFSGKTFIYSSTGDTLRVQYISNDSVKAYEEFFPGLAKEKWIVKRTDEEFFVDVNKDTLNLEDTYIIKFIVNHRIADSIRIYDSDSSIIFKWPEHGSTSFKYKLQPRNVGRQSLREEFY